MSHYRCREENRTGGERVLAALVQARRAAPLLSPHSLRYSAITFALDAGATLRDVQDYAGHKDPRTTRRYDNPQELHQTGEKPHLVSAGAESVQVPGGGCLLTWAGLVLPLDA
jgi:integrase